MYDIYRYIFIGAAIACGILLAVSVFLFFKLRIPKVISDLSGKTERRAVENIRRQNEESGDKMYKSSAVNLERGKLTEKISASGRLMTREETPFGVGNITQKIATQELSPEEVGGTTVLEPAYETMVLNQLDSTLELPEENGQTSVLSQEGGQTTVLSAQPQAAVFEILYDITYIHTAEVIPQEAV